jgi:hypothetical protein
MSTWRHDDAGRLSCVTTKEPKRKGPRGGETQVTPGGFRKKAFYLLPDEVQAIRRAAFDRDCSESEVVRQAVRAYFDLDR